MTAKKKHSTRRFISDEEIVKVTTDRATGMTHSQLAEKHGRARSVIHRMLVRAKSLGLRTGNPNLLAEREAARTGQPKRKKGKGKRKIVRAQGPGFVLTPAYDEALIQKALNETNAVGDAIRRAANTFAASLVGQPVRQVTFDLASRACTIEFSTVETFRLQP